MDEYLELNSSLLPFRLQPGLLLACGQMGLTGSRYGHLLLGSNTAPIRYQRP